MSTGLLTRDFFFSSLIFNYSVYKNICVDDFFILHPFKYGLLLRHRSKTTTVAVIKYASCDHISEDNLHNMKESSVRIRLVNVWFIQIRLIWISVHTHMWQNKLPIKMYVSNPISVYLFSQQANESNSADAYYAVII